MVRSGDRRLLRLVFLATLCVFGTASAQTLYKYRGDNGEWIYSDRPPDDGQQAESRTLRGGVAKGAMSVTHSFDGTSLVFVASNTFHAPMQVGIEFDAISGVDYPHPDETLRWVVPARSERVVLNLPSLEGVSAPSVSYHFVYLPGDPDHEANASHVYRAPFSAGSSFQVTQTYPESVTHRTRDSMYAVDIAMPVGTDIVAARDGIVFDVASTNFKGGPNADQYADLANLVRVLHDDGTYALYAHLNWNTIRVRPGDRVRAGQYIADSGNTGFTSGPHLHFAVQHNVGMRVDSLRARFRGPGDASVMAASGEALTAYP